MKGDFTRNTFDVRNHFSRVLMQQGRVQLDADWNEQSAILLHYLQTLAADLIGSFGGPRDNCGFEIVTDSTGKIATDITGKDEESISEKKRLEELGVTFPLKPGDFLIGKGRYYVDGVLCENEHFVPFSAQPDVPAPELLKTGSHLIYLDVWERHVTHFENDLIREVALSGADTATRAKIVWQVKAHAKDEGGKDPSVLKGKDIHTNWGEWVKLFEPENRGLLSVQVKQPDSADLNNPCATPPDARYRGAENQLYRIEIHQSGKADKTGKTGNASFKWSRENGSVIFPILPSEGDAITLAQLNRDTQLGLKPGDWVEIIDDEIVLRGDVPPLAQVDSIEFKDSRLRLKPSPNFPQYDEKKHPLLRRWDHKSDVASGGTISITESNWLPLEDGIQVQFQPGGNYRAGDYWLIPARTATGGIEWAKDDNGDPLPQPRTASNTITHLWLSSLKPGR